MSRLSILAAAAAIAVMVVSVAPASASWSTTFSGTRDQVRAACAAIGGALTESPGSSLCMNSKNGTGVSCDNDGKCAGSGPGSGPTRASGIWGKLGGIVAPTTGTRR